MRDFVKCLNKVFRSQHSLPKSNSVKDKCKKFKINSLLFILSFFVLFQTAFVVLTFPSVVHAQQSQDKEKLAKFNSIPPIPGITKDYIVLGETLCTIDADCEDGDKCTLDQCIDGRCVNAIDPTHCPACTTDADCNDGLTNTTDTCVNGACHFTPVGCTTDADCSDGDACNGSEKCFNN